jgi:hypothetical protein
MAADNQQHLQLIQIEVEEEEVQLLLGLMLLDV